MFSRVQPPLILASTSVYRRELLARLRLPFETLPPQVAEAHLDGESQVDRALRLAHEKAHALARQRPEAVVIGSDQVAAAGDQSLDKPGDAERCRAQLRLLSGGIARFHTACVVLGVHAAVHLAHVDTTTVFVRALTDAEIERYVASERPFDCAGGFKAEGSGIALFERIESQDPTAFIGLPLIWLAGALRAAGQQVP
ncbi:MAG: Maf family protein [Steroidobacteraceae bacterium]